MSERKKRFRTKLLVDRTDQARIILETSLSMFGCLIFAVVVEGFYRRQVAAGVIHSDGTLLGMPDERLGMLVLFVSAATVQIVSALLSSQKVAGATYRIKLGLAEFRSGATQTRMRLRTGDHHHELAGEIDSFLDWVEERMVPAGVPAASTGGRREPAGTPYMTGTPRAPRPDRPPQTRQP